ncbi:MAG: transcription termination/antitermination factor NusG [Planctomycetales bacterium]|nr:transcription termination/antitermination factor NusG [Planctomycetales bacterium]
MDWFILKVQSNRENSICDALKRRVAVEGLDRFFGDILVPTEDVAEFKNGKRRVVKRKLYPGYIVAHMVINDDTWFLVRETPGIGDFTGAAGKPSPMLPHEVERIVKSSDPEEGEEEQIKTAIPFRIGDRVRIKEGTFENFEGDVDNIDEANGRITVVINIFNRSTPVELEHWQVETV